VRDWLVFASWFLRPAGRSIDRQPCRAFVLKRAGGSRRSVGGAGSLVLLLPRGGAGPAHRHSFSPPRPAPSLTGQLFAVALVQVPIEQPMHARALAPRTPTPPARSPSGICTAWRAPSGRSTGCPQRWKTSQGEFRPWRSAEGAGEYPRRPFSPSTGNTWSSEWLPAGL